MKDSLVITAEGADVEVIPFIQLWMLLPATLLATWVFTYLASRYSQRTLFQLVLGGFLAFFVVFTCVLYPLRDFIHLHEFALGASAQLPNGLRGLVGMLRNWSFSAFFTMSELWGSMVTSVLFWSFANAISNLQQAKRSYGLYAMGGNLGATMAGLIPPLVGGISPELSIYILLVVIIVSGLVSLAVFQWLTRYVLIGSEYDCIHQVIDPSEKPEKISLLVSLRMLICNRYLLCLAVIVFAFNFVNSIGGVVWKDQLKRVCGDFNAYNNYLGYTTTAIGVGAMILAGFLPRILNTLGWTATAMLCPASTGVASVCFFGILCFGSYLPFESVTILGIVVLTGGLMEVLGRMTKYSVFDGTKDLAFIPLETELKLKSKAVIDGALSRIAISGSAIVQQLCIIVFSSLGQSMPMIFVIITGCIFVWVVSACSLGYQFADLTQQSVKNSSACKNLAQAA